MRYRMLAAAVALAGAPAAQAEEPKLPAWMAGCWEMRDGARWAEECWTIPRGGMMIGSGRQGHGDTVTDWEMMRIALDEEDGDGPIIRMAFVAAPRGMGWTTFGWSAESGAGVAFFNVANDYPQQIRYWREGKLLKARISMADGSKPMEWTFSRMGE